jgi:UDP-GlcNAc:undecaprenyl-phosphate/decaprenyl-phosphate GlcNAc-1-phosphate transferase
MVMDLFAQIDVPRHTVDSILAPHIYVFYASFLIAFVFTPIMGAIAHHYQVLDRPDKMRKLHAAPVAYLGGVAVFLGWLGGLAFSQFHIGYIDNSMPHSHVQIGIVIGAMLVVLLGLWDDLLGIRPWIKIAGQVAAAAILLWERIGTHCLDPMVTPINLRLQLAGWPMIPEWAIIAASVVTVLFLVVGCCNATNLMDGLDGLCGGVTAIIAAGFLFLAVHLATVGTDPEHDGLRVVLAFALLGGVMGFIPYNFNPASIFMGDTGSMFLGYACATTIILLAHEQSRWFLAAMVMFSLPVLDTGLAIARRWVNRRSLFSADRHHFHHQLVARGLSIRKTVLISYALSIGFALLGAMIVFVRTRYAVAVYLVTFGSIIVAAYKMGMVHEKPRVVGSGRLQAGGVGPMAIDLEPGTVLEIRPEDARPIGVGGAKDAVENARR